MVTAIILMNVERKEINTVAEQLAGMEEISEAYSVSGKNDLVAIVRVRNNEKLSDLVTKKLTMIPSITRTETLLALRAYSRHDLEAVFDIGLD
ncbi:MAG: Lrp/AsnC ligand binding domain-containing protein [Phycisphaerae bacterium]|nr:Lrp/AsnC ligand binding domain-containing protein [Phycisphaerae bacterium]